MPVFDVAQAEQDFKGLLNQLERAVELLETKDRNAQKRGELAGEIGKEICRYLSGLGQDPKAYTADKLPQDPDIKGFLDTLDKYAQMGAKEWKDFLAAAKTPLSEFNKLRTAVGKEVLRSAANPRLTKLHGAIEKLWDEIDDAGLPGDAELNSSVDELKAHFRKIVNQELRSAKFREEETFGILRTRLEPRKGKDVRNQAEKGLKEIEKNFKLFEKTRKEVKPGYQRTLLRLLKESESALEVVQNAFSFWKEAMDTIDPKKAKAGKASKDLDARTQYDAYLEALKTLEIVRSAREYAIKFYEQMEKNLKQR
jgi:hypothetical protein